MRLPRWADADLALLREMVAAGKADDEIAAELNRRAGREERTAYGVKTKRQRAGLCKRRPASGPKVTPKGGDQRGALLMGAVIEGRPPDEALRSRCRQLAHDLGRGGQLSLWQLKRSHGYTDGSLAALLDEGKRWFERTVFGVALTDLGARELIGGRGAA